MILHGRFLRWPQNQGKQTLIPGNFTKTIFREWRPVCVNHNHILVNESFNVNPELKTLVD